jgi:release factor glutamine methyltransferase
MNTVEAARRTLSARFNTAGIESAELDARLLIGAVLRLDLTGLIVAASRQITDAESAELESLAARRLNGEPVARILGEKEFWGLSLKLSADTLVPRPDTETVVELALESLRTTPNKAAARIIDIGTGSGAILLALLHELPGSFGIGTDISEAALVTARNNAKQLGLARRAAFMACHYAAAIAGRFDLIVSNPPYISSADIAELAREVRDHDPPRALDGGADGLDAYRALIPQAAGLLAAGGTLIVEAGIGQRGAIEALMTASRLRLDPAAKCDLSGISRAIAGRKMA